MEGNTFARPSSHLVLTIVIFIFLAISRICSACDDNSSTIPTNSTKTNYITYTAPSNNSSQTTNYENTTIPSNTTQINNYENATIPSNNTTQTSMTYIKNSCNSTTYPSICYQSLSPYASKIEADPLKLCNVSLSLALKAAHSASSTISKLLMNSNDNNLTGIAEQVVKDCFGNVKESIGELKDSLDAMSHLGDSYIDKDFQISNIKTWVSAAITNDQTCYDGFDEMNVDPTVRDRIRKSVLDVARKTSNALYFINNNIY